VEISKKLKILGKNEQWDRNALTYCPEFLFANNCPNEGKTSSNELLTYELIIFPREVHLK
jgi:hypothetical protein